MDIARLAGVGFPFVMPPVTEWSLPASFDWTTIVQTPPFPLLRSRPKCTWRELR